MPSSGNHRTGRFASIARGDSWVFGLEEPYELAGDVPNVAIDNDGDTIYVYYGAADTCIGVATGSTRVLLRWLAEHGPVSS